MSITADKSAIRGSRDTIQRLVAVAFVALLWLPITQMLLHWAGRPARLGGVESAPSALPQPNSKNWFDGSFQKRVGDWYSREVGFRNWLVRTDNQLRLSLFGELGGEVYVGEEDVLFSDEYRTARTWTDALRTAAIETRVSDLALLARELERHGVECATVISPSKNRVQAQLLPAAERAARALARPTVYDVAKSELERSGVRFRDFCETFATWHRSEPIPVFPKGGLHWSSYHGARAAQLLIHDMESWLERDLPSVRVQTTELLERPVSPDDDLIGLANIWDDSRFWGTTQGFEVSLDESVDRAPAKVLVVGTSFTAGITSTLVLACERLTTYHYFVTRYEHERFGGGVRGPAQAIPADPAALRAAILGYDIVILEVFEPRLDNLGFGFIDAAIEAFGLRQRATTLTAEIDAAFAGPGCRIRLSLDAGSKFAGFDYTLAGSLSGTTPGTRINGRNVPLVFDAYTTASMSDAPPDGLHGFRGKLDADGRAEATLVLPAEANPKIQRSISHAFLLLDRNGAVEFVSNAATIELDR